MSVFSRIKRSKVAKRLLLVFTMLAIGGSIFAIQAPNIIASDKCVSVPDPYTGKSLQMHDYFSASVSRSGNTAKLTVTRKDSAPLCKDQEMVFQSFNMGPNWNGKSDRDGFLSSLPQTMAYATHLTLGKFEKSKTVTVQTPDACKGTQVDLYVGSKEITTLTLNDRGITRQVIGKIFLPTETCKPNVAITKTVGEQQSETLVVQKDDSFIYTIKATNTGNVSLANVVISDTAPQGIQFVSAKTGNTDILVDGNKVSYTVPTLATGQSVEIVITAKSTTVATSPVVNKACVETPTIPATNPDACDTASTTTPEPPKPHVSIDKVVNGAEKAEVAVGETFTYTIVVKNDGGVNLVNAVVSDPAPQGVQFLTTDKGTITGNTLSYTIPALAVGQGETIKVTAKVTSYVATALVNTACVDAKEVPGDKDDCDDATVTVKKPLVPHVSIDKVVNGVESTEVAVDGTFTYTLVVKNDGEVNLVNAVVSDQAPANVQFLSTDKGSIVNNSLSYTIPSLAVGASDTIKITAKVTTYVSGAIVNTACVNAMEVPGDKDDCDDATVTVVKPLTPHVSIDKVVNGVNVAQVKVNEPFVYTLKVTNDGQVDLKNAVVTDQAPANVTFISSDKGTIANNTLSYTIPALAVGQSETIKITAKVTAEVTGAIVNTACVDAMEIPGTKDDCDDATVTVPEPGKVEVCNPATGTIISVPEADKDKYEPADSPKCSKMQVCVIADGTGTMTTITKDQYDATKHSSNPSDCKDIKVCRLSDKQYPVTIKESALNSNYSVNADDCKTVTPPTVIELPHTGIASAFSLVGAGALAYAGYAYFMSRRG